MPAPGLQHGRPLQHSHDANPAGMRDILGLQCGCLPYVAFAGAPPQAGAPTCAWCSILPGFFIPACRLPSRRWHGLQHAAQAQLRC